MVGWHTCTPVFRHDFDLVYLNSGKFYYKFNSYLGSKYASYSHILRIKMNKLKILVTRAIFPETLEKLAQHFDIESNQADDIWTKSQLIEKLQGKVGAFTFGL